jgi:1-hydroxycarotenoid 3,4-desaturase
MSLDPSTAAGPPRRSRAAAAEPAVLVIGAGIAGLVATVKLAARGVPVTLLERAATPGGKLGAVVVAGHALDGGPTVLTMLGELQAVLGDALPDLARELGAVPAAVLARHAWSDGSMLDLYADRERTVEAIAAFAGAQDAAAYRRFCDAAAALHAAVAPGLLRAERPSLSGLLNASGLRGTGALFGLSPLRSLAAELRRRFRDPRLQQLFGRYATYVGSSPFEAPATLATIAHVEREGVWLVPGGVHRLADLLARHARRTALPNCPSCSAATSVASTTRRACSRSPSASPTAHTPSRSVSIRHPSALQRSVAPRRRA